MRNLEKVPYKFPISKIKTGTQMAAFHVSANR